MIIGQALACEQNGAPVYYSAWFPRGGNRARVTCNLIHAANLSASTGLEIVVESKNSEQSDKDAATNPTWSSGAVSLTSNSDTSWIAGDSVDSSNAGLLELVRYKFILRGGTSADGFAHLRMLPPQWFSN